ncbi:hypothetical protein GQ61_07305 [Candidatus Nucleicultrix amoebiphila FS5]|uniref:Peptidase S1 domain-containing protein n=2 Tax=Candidatus Nucleicultrix TaxID=1509243 RepID=A0A1W6N5S0_9PROT|nr:hypothetical protein GQ61_07305 [Candidatus Nucleicultrix amoebiphila FS5]
MDKKNALISKIFLPKLFIPKGSLMKLSSLFSIILTLLSSTLNASLMFEGIDEEKYIKEARKYPAVCQIFMKGSTGIFAGTGTLCETDDGKKFILTAGHVLDEKTQGKGKVRFSDGTKTKISALKIHERYLDAEVISKSYVDIAIFTVNAYPAHIKPMKIGKSEEFTEDAFVTAIGFGKRGVYNASGRGHYLPQDKSERHYFLKYYSALKDPRAVILKTKLNEDSFSFSKTQGCKTLNKVYERKTPSPLEGGISSGGSGGPIVQDDKIFGVIASGAKDLVDFQNPGDAPIYRSIESSGISKLLNQTELLLPAFLQKPFRSIAQKIFHLPDFSVNSFQTMTFLTPKLQGWIVTSVDEFYPRESKEEIETLPNIEDDHPGESKGETIAIIPSSSKEDDDMPGASKK